MRLSARFDYQIQCGKLTQWHEKESRSTLLPAPGLEMHALNQVKKKKISFSKVGSMGEKRKFKPLFTRRISPKIYISTWLSVHCSQSGPLGARSRGWGSFAGRLEAVGWLLEGVLGRPRPEEQAQRLFNGLKKMFILIFPTQYCKPKKYVG